MAMQEACTRLLCDLGQAIGIPALKADAQGCCRLLFEGDRTVELRAAPAQVRWVLSCTLRAQAMPNALLHLLLRASYMGAGFGGGWAGLDERGLCVLHLPVPLEQASVPQLLEAMELLLEHSERWEQRMAAAVQAVDAPPRTAAWA